MRFSTIFAVLAAGAMAFASAVPEIIEKRATAETALTDLSNQCDTILPKFGGCSDITCSTAVVVELCAAIDTCTGVLGGVGGGLPYPALVTLVFNIIDKIIVALNNHKTTCGSGCPGLLDVYTQVDVSLSVCLQAVFGLFLGLAALVAVLLLPLLAILQGLDLSLIIGICF